MLLEKIDKIYIKIENSYSKISWSREKSHKSTENACNRKWQIFGIYNTEFPEIIIDKALSTLKGFLLRAPRTQSFSEIPSVSMMHIPLFFDFTCHIFLFSLAKLGLRKLKKVHRLKGNNKHDSESSFTFLAHFFLLQMPVLPQKGCQKSSSLTPLACLWLYS